MKLRLAPLAAGVLAAIPLWGHATDWPEVPNPPRSSVEWVAKDIRVNGMHSRIEHFGSELMPDELLAYYRRLWSTSRPDEPPAKEVSAAGWMSIATLRSHYQLAVQVRAGSHGGSDGLISVADLSDLRPDYVPQDWPRWSDATIMQVTESVDGPKLSQTVSAISSDSLSAVVEHYRQAFSRQGFLVAQEHATSATGSTRGWLALLNKGTKTVDLAIAQGGEEGHVFITANLVQPAEGSRP
jgi:hypothetical protein